MVRTFAASAIVCVKKQQKARKQTGYSAVNTEATLLDRAVPLLVLIFLSVAAVSITLQFTSSRNAQLKISEDSLAISAHFLATEMARQARDANDTPFALRCCRPRFMSPAGAFCWST